MSIRILLGLVLISGLSAQADPAGKLDIDAFRAQCRLHRLGANDSNRVAPPLGQVSYVAAASVDGTQSSFSFYDLRNDLNDLRDSQEKGHGRKKGDHREFAYDAGRSLYSPEEFSSGIFYRGRTFIVGDHTRAFASSYLGAPTVPVKIVADMSERFSPAQFLDYLEENGFAHFRDARGINRGPIDICEMADLPILGLAKLIIGRVEVNPADGHMEIQRTKDAGRVLAMTTAANFPSLVLSVAEILLGSGVKWDPEGDKRISKHDLKTYLQILKDSKLQAHSRPNELLLLDKPRWLNDLIAPPVIDRIEDLDFFRLYCRLHRLGANEVRNAKIAAGTVLFVPTLTLDSTQWGFSFYEVLQKLGKYTNPKNEFSAQLDPESKKWIFKFNNGRSLYPESKKIKGILYRGRIFIVDGHHRAMLSLYLGAETIPMEILEEIDERDSPAEALKYLVFKQRSHFRDAQDRPAQPTDLSDLEDYPNLGLVRRLIGRVTVQIVNGDLQVEESAKGRMVIGLTTILDMPFLEYYLAFILYSHGVVWDPATDDEITEAQMKTYLEYFQEAAKTPNSGLDEVLLLDKPRSMADLDAKRLIKDHARKLTCAHLLKRRIKGAP